MVCQDLDRRLDHEKTFLMHAAAGGEIQDVKDLLQKGADVALVDDRGFTARDWATQTDNIAIATLLELCEEGNWNQFLTIQAMARGLAHEAQLYKKTIVSMLDSPQFSNLKKQKVEVPFQTDFSIWFRVSDEIHIGLTEDHEMMWEIQEEVFQNLH